MSWTSPCVTPPVNRVTLAHIAEEGHLYAPESEDPVPQTVPEVVSDAGHSPLRLREEWRPQCHLRCALTSMHTGGGQLRGLAV